MALKSGYIMPRDASLLDSRWDIFQSGIFFQKRLLCHLENLQQPCVLLTGRLASLIIMVVQLRSPETLRLPRQYGTGGFKGGGLK